MNKTHRVIILNNDLSLGREITTILRSIEGITHESGLEYSISLKISSCPDIETALDALASGSGDRLIINLAIQESEVLLIYLKKRAISVPTICIGVSSHEETYRQAYSFVRTVINRDDLIRSHSRIQEAILAPPALEGSRHDMNRDVFVIHGRNEGDRDRIRNILYSLGMNPIYLSGNPINSGAIIEEIEAILSRVCFAIAILSGDDIGYLNGASKAKKSRPRQNVVFEAGLCIGRLGRKRVLLMPESGIESPSDMDGILYVPLASDDHILHNRIIQSLANVGITCTIKM